MTLGLVLEEDTRPRRRQAAGEKVDRFFYHGFLIQSSRPSQDFNILIAVPASPRHEGSIFTDGITRFHIARSTRHEINTHNRSLVPGQCLGFKVADRVQGPYSDRPIPTPRGQDGRITGPRQARGIVGLASVGPMQCQGSKFLVQMIGRTPNLYVFTVRHGNVLSIRTVLQISNGLFEAKAMQNDAPMKVDQEGIVLHIDHHEHGIVRRQDQTTNAGPGFHR